MIERTGRAIERRPPGEKQLTWFGYGGAALCAGLAVYLSLRGSLWEYPLAGLSGLLLALTLFARPALSFVYRVWMSFGLALGWINLRLVMALTLYLVFTPVRLIQTIFGRDPLNRRIDRKRESYFVQRKPLDPKRFDRMF